MLERNIELEIAREIEDAIDVRLVLEIRDGVIIVSSLVETEGSKDAALTLVRGALPDMEVLDNIEVVGVLPARIGHLRLTETESGGIPGASAGTEDDDALEPGNFTDQRLLQDASNEMGPAALEGGQEDEDVSEGEDVYVPPMDPVLDADGEVLGGFSLTSMDDVEVERSASDGRRGDEAIAAAVRRELREDAATTALQIKVLVREGVVHLRGVVEDMLDVDSAEEVASRVPGVVRVVEELDVSRTAF